MPLSFIMTEAECKAVDCYSFLSAGRKKTDGQKKKKREGTEQIEPFHHTHLPLSLQQALPNLFCFPTNDEQDASPSETSVSLPLLNIALTLFQHLRQFRHEQPSFLPACTNTRPRTLSLSLPPALPLSASITLSLTNTH